MKQRYLTDELLNKLDKLVLGAVGNPQLLPDNWDYDQVLSLIENLANTFLTPSEIEASLSIQDGEPVPRESREIKNHRLLSLYSGLRQKYFENEQAQEQDINNAKKDIIDKAYEASLAEENRLSEIEAEIGKKGLNKEFELAQQKISQIRAKYNIKTDGSNVLALQATLDPQEAFPSTARILQQDQHGIITPSLQTFEVLDDLAGLAASLETHPYIATIKYKIKEASPQELDSDQSNFLVAAVASGISAKNSSLSRKILERTGISLDDAQSKPLPITNDTVISLSNLLEEDSTLAGQQQAVEYLQQQSGLSKEESAKTISTIAQEINIAKETQEVSDADIFTPLITASPQVPIDPNELQQIAPIELVEKAAEIYVLEQTLKTQLPQPQYEKVTKALAEIGPNEFNTSNTNLGSFLTNQNIDSARITQIIEDFQTRKLQAATPNAYTSPIESIQTVLKNGHQPNSQEVVSILTTLGYTPDQIKNITTELTNSTSPQSELKSTLAKQTTLNNTAISQVAANTALKTLPEDSQAQFQTELNSLTTPPDTVTILKISKKLNIPVDQQTKFLTEYDQTQTSLLQESLQQQVLQHTAKTASQSPAELQDQLKNLGLKPDQIEIAVKNLKNLPANQPAQAISTTKEIVESVSSVSVNYTSAYEAISATLPENKKQLALSDLSQLDKHSITEVSVAAILAKHATNPNQITQGLESYSQNQNLILQKVASTTSSIDQSLSKPLIKIYTDSTSPEEAIKQAAELIVKNSKTSEILATAQAESSYHAFKETLIQNPQEISQKLEAHLNSLDQAAKSGSVTVAIESVKKQLFGLAPELSAKSRQELAVEIVNSSRTGKDINQTVNSYVSTSIQRSEAALISKTNIPTLPSPITHSDRVLFATNAAIQSTALILNTETIKEIAQAHASLSPEIAKQKTVEILEKVPAQNLLSPDQLATRISTNISLQLQNADTKTLIENVVQNNQVTLSSASQIKISQILDNKDIAINKSPQISTSVSRSQQIDEIIKSENKTLSSDQISKITTDITTAHAAITKSQPLNTSLKTEIESINQNPNLSLQDKILQTRLAYSSAIYGPLTKEQSAQIKYIAKSNLSTEEKATQINTKLQEFGLSPTASKYLSSKISSPKPFSSEQIIRTNLEPKSPDKLINLVNGSTKVTTKDMIINSLTSTGLSIKVSSDLLPDLPSLHQATANLPQNLREKIFVDYVQKTLDPSFRPNPNQIKNLENSFKLLNTSSKNIPLRPEFANNLIQNYTLFSPETKRAVDSIFQNEKNYSQALSQLLGSKELAEKFISNNLHNSVFVLADHAHKSDIILSGKGSNFDKHFKNSLDTHLRFLQENGNLKPKDIELIKSLRTKLSDPNYNTESLKTIFQFPIKNFKFTNAQGVVQFNFSPKFLKQVFTDSNGNASNFFKFITNKDNFPLNSYLNQFSTIKRAFTHPDLKSIAQNILSPQKFLDFVKNFSLDRINPLNQYTNAMILKGRSSLIFRGGSAIYTRLAATKLGGAIIKPIASIANKIAIKVAEKLGLQIIGSAAPVIGNAIAFIIGVISDVIEKIFGKTLSKLKKFIEEGLGGAGVGVALSAGGITAGIGTFFIGAVSLVSSLIIGAVSSIIGPLFISTILTPIIIAMFLFITTNSSYVVPPTQYTFGSPTAPDGSAVILPPDPTGDNPRCWPFRSQDANRLFVSRGPSIIHRNSIDIASGEQRGPTGTIPVYATHNGTVEIRSFDSDGYGTHIYLHGSGRFHTIYAHLHRTSVPNGSVVGRGTLLGYLGNTGNSTGAHLHYQIEPSPPNFTNRIVPPYTTGARISGGFAGDPGDCGTINRPSIAPSLPPQTP